jgi:hypothetical protein
MAGKPKRVVDDQKERLKVLLAQANARYRTLLKNRQTVSEASRCFDSILELERQISLLEHRTAQPYADDPERGSLRFIVRYQRTKGLAGLSDTAFDDYLMKLLLHRAERAGSSEKLQASIARTVSEIGGITLPPELAAEVRELLDMVINGAPDDDPDRVEEENDEST